MLGGRLKFTGAEQRSHDFRENAGRWGRRFWIPTCVIGMFLLIVLLILRPQIATPYLIGGLLIAAGSGITYLFKRHY